MIHSPGFRIDVLEKDGEYMEEDTQHHTEDVDGGNHDLGDGHGLALRGLEPHELGELREDGHWLGRGGRGRGVCQDQGSACSVSIFFIVRRVSPYWFQRRMPCL